MVVWFILACLAFLEVTFGVGDSEYCVKFLFNYTIIMAFNYIQPLL